MMRNNVLFVINVSRRWTSLLRSGRKSERSVPYGSATWESQC